MKKPAAFQEMLEVVQTLCQGFDFVRVDLYEVNGKVYFGEMTFTSDAGIGRVEPQEWDDKLGALWKFDDVLKARQRKIGREK